MSPHEDASSVVPDLHGQARRTSPAQRFPGLTQARGTASCGWGPSDTATRPTAPTA